MRLNVFSVVAFLDLPAICSASILDGANAGVLLKPKLPRLDVVLARDDFLVAKPINQSEAFLAFLVIACKRTARDRSLGRIKSN